MKSTLSPKAAEIERRWWVVDGTGVPVGRLSTRIARLILGKGKANWAPHVDCGDFVIVINADKVRMTGTKEQTKEYDSYSGYPGGHKYWSYEKQKQVRPEAVIELAVRRMLPKTKSARNMFRRLKVYAGPKHDHQSQKPEKIELS